MFEKLTEKIQQMKNPTVIGLDPRIEYVPEHIRAGRDAAEAIYEFNCGLIDSVCDIVPAVKPQAAYYELLGLKGIEVLYRTMEYAKSAGMYVILDAKRGDIGATSSAYAEAYLSDGCPADALTVNPYLGSDGVKPFLDVAKTSGKAIFTLVKTSNPSSSELQDIVCDGEPIYRKMASLVKAWGEEYGIGADGYTMCGAVVGATHPEQLIELRKFMPNTFFLVPGYGAQGGKAEDIIPAYGKDNSGVIVNSSRALICAYKKSDDPTGMAYKDATRAAAIAMREELWK